MIACVVVQEYVTVHDFLPKRLQRKLRQLGLTTGMSMANRSGIHRNNKAEPQYIYKNIFFIFVPFFSTFLLRCLYPR